MVENILRIRKYGQIDLGNSVDGLQMSKSVRCFRENPKASLVVNLSKQRESGKMTPKNESISSQKLQETPDRPPKIEEKEIGG